jgi:hypothetical protein
MRSKANTVNDYLKSLPEDRRKVVAAVRKVILNSLKYPSLFSICVFWMQSSF